MPAVRKFILEILRMKSSSSRELRSRVGKSTPAATRDADDAQLIRDYIYEAERSPEYVARRREYAQLFDYYWRKATALFWIATAVAMLAYTDMFRDLFHSPNVNQGVLIAGIVFVSLCGIVILYLAIFVVKDDSVSSELEWHAEYPWITYSLGGGGILGCILLIAGLWGEYSWFSPVLIIVVFMAYISCSQFVTARGTKGVAIMAAIVILPILLANVTPYPYWKSR